MFFLKENFKVSDIPSSVSSQTIIITGANTGLGKEATLRLAEKGAHV
jgi:short-subunit dehydrogenase